MLREWERAAACAVIAIGVPFFVAVGQTVEAARGSGEEEIATPAINTTIDMDGLGATPRFMTVPDPEAAAAATVASRSQNVVLVPLPAPFWAATSGLTSLVLIAAWRRHRLRSE